MIISPPFLPARADNLSDAAWLDLAFAPALPLRETNAPAGSYPLGIGLGWHNGLHVQGAANANNQTTVHAIADGEVIHVSVPRPSNTDPGDAQNFNPFPGGAAWTDNGLVILRHQTEIGATGDQPTSLTYFSAYMHLERLPTFATPEGGTRRLQAGDRVWRKDVIGHAGRIYGHAGQTHLEICLDQDNLQQLMGRPPAWVDPANIPAPSADGRVDAVFGAIWFYLPATTPTSTIAPTSHLRAASQTSLAQAVWVRMHYVDGSANFQSHDSNGRLLGERGEANGEYNLYRTASNRHQSLPAADRAHSSPSGWYELLRFGRNLGRGPAATDKDPLPANAAHWRQLSINGQDIWADLNAEGSYKFSDADFLPIQGWNIIDDDSNPADQRCDSNRLKNLIADPDPNAENRLETATLEPRLGDPEVRRKLQRMICRFPSEWDRDTIATRYGFVRELPAFRDAPDAWAPFEAHLNALTFTGLPADYLAAQWRVHPKEFIGWMRQCGWLSSSELELVYPNTYEQKVGAVIHRAANALNNQTRERFRFAINTVSRKYFISQNSVRQAHYFGQGAEESRTLTLMNERRSEASCNQLYSGRMGNDLTGDGYRYRGRGMKQLTGKYNYSEYWVFRGWIDRSSYTASWWSAQGIITRPDINNPDRLLNDVYSTIDTGGWYWVASPHRGTPHNDSSISALTGNGHPNDQNIRFVTRGINGGINGLDNRIHHTQRIYRIMADGI